MIDTVIYETKGKPTYVIQFVTENGEWRDTGSPFRSSIAAINELNSQKATPYAHRVIERKA